MFVIKYGDEYLYDVIDRKTVLSDVTLSQEENEFAYFDFTIEYTHPLYSEITEHDIRHLITIRDNNYLVFVGYVYEIELDFKAAKHIKCKDAMSFLEDSIIRPYSTAKNPIIQKAPAQLNKYIEFIINEHNEQVQNIKKIYPGNIQTPFEARGIVDIKNTSYPTTYDELKKQITDIYGGYFSLRYDNNIFYLDYTLEDTRESEQILDFGVSILDLTHTKACDNIKTFVVPLGAKLSETEYDYFDGYFVTKDKVPDPEKEYYTATEKKHSFNKWSWKKEFDKDEKTGQILTYYEHDADRDESDLLLTINRVNVFPEGVPDGKIYSEYFYKRDDYIYNTRSYDIYGAQGYSLVNEKIKTIPELVLFGAQDLYSKTNTLDSIEVKAIDLHGIHSKPILIGDNVRIRSVYHSIDQYFTCNNISINITNPENTTYKFGVKAESLTGNINSIIASLNSKINKYWDDESKNEKIAKQALLFSKQNMQSLNNKKYGMIINKNTNKISYLQNAIGMEPIDNINDYGTWYDVFFKPKQTNNILEFNYIENIYYYIHEEEDRTIFYVTNYKENSNYQKINDFINIKTMTNNEQKFLSYIQILLTKKTNTSLYF